MSDERLKAMAKLRSAFLAVEDVRSGLDGPVVTIPTEKWRALVTEIHRLFGLEAILAKKL